MKGWVDGPMRKHEDGYLSNATWVGELPGTYMGVPYGLGSQCWYSVAYLSAVGSIPPQWCERKTFASLEYVAAVEAAEEWLKEQESG